MRVGTKGFAGVLALMLATVALAADPPRPVGLVEAVANAPAAKLSRFDYLYAGTTVDLRPAGALTVAWFDNCVVETFTGGQVRLEKARARVTGGKAERRMRPCPTSAVKLAPSRTEAGVAIKRVTPFAEGQWREITVRAERPTFVWPAGSEASVVVSFLDANPKMPVWRGTSTASSLTYAGPRLAPGAPYEVRVERAGAPVLTAVFSIDPALAVEDGSAAEVVPLGL